MATRDRSKARELRRQWVERNPEKAREMQWRANLKYLYGISSDQYERQLARQKGVCAICRRPCSTRKRLAVDHDHKTGRNRGLLCRTCNQVVGKFEDDPELFERAAAYLRDQQEQFT